MSQHTRSHVTTHTVTCHNIQGHMSQHTGSHVTNTRSHVTTHTVTCHNIHGHMSQHTWSHVTTYRVTCHNTHGHMSQHNGSPFHTIAHNIHSYILSFQLLCNSFIPFFILTTFNQRDIQHNNCIIYNY